MRKTIIKQALQILVVSSLVAGMTACNQSPVRNPFAGRVEPKLGDLPDLSYEDEIQPKLAWKTSALSKQPRFSKLLPHVTENVVYVADNQGHVVAIDKAEGKALWKQKTKHHFTAGPKRVADLVVLATADAKVVALEANTGKKRWEVKVTSEVLAAPNGNAHAILVNAMDGSVTGLSVQDGRQLWQVQQSTPSLTLHYGSAPAIVGDTAIVGFSTGKLQAINLSTGNVEWDRAISFPRGRSELQRMVDISADPIVVADTVYAITYQGKLAALDVRNGDLKWERDLSSYQNMAVADDMLYVTDNEHNLWAIDRHQGTTVWKQTNLANRFITGPAVIDDTVVVNDRAGYMHFLTQDKGLLVNRYHFSGKFYQGPITVGEQVIVNSHNGKVAAIRMLDETTQS